MMSNVIKIQETITNSDGTFNLVLAQDQRVIRLHSSRPKAEADKIFAQLPPKSQAYFIGGLGFGYLLEKILEETTAICLVYEPISIILETTLKIRPELKLILENPRVFFMQDMISIPQMIQDEKLHDISFTIHRPYNDLFPDQFVEVKDQIVVGIRRYEVGNSTLLRFGKIWTKNFFRNMHRFFKSQKLIPYLGWASQKPAIIVAAGPSLEAALPFLQKQHTQALLIACDTALPMLLQAQINPDFVVTVDPQEKNSLYLRYSANKDHILIADPAIHDSTFEGYENQNIILMDSVFPLYSPFEGFWGHCGLLASGGSVSTSAFDFARKIGSDPIIMVGQDLSFTKKKTYSSGNVLSEFSRTTHHRLNSFHALQAKATHTDHSQYIKGRLPNSTVYVDSRFMLYRDWFSLEIPKTSAQVIVAGMEGAYLEGAQHTTVEQAFSLLNKDIDKKTIAPTNPIQKEEYTKFIEDIFITTNKLIPTCAQILIAIKQAYASKNLNMAIHESSRLQQQLSLPENHKISLFISVSIQESIQLAQGINPHTSKQEHLQILLNICKDTLEALKSLNHQIKKSQKFIAK